MSRRGGWSYGLRGGVFLTTKGHEEHEGFFWLRIRGIAGGLRGSGDLPDGGFVKK